MSKAVGKLTGKVKDSFFGGAEKKAAKAITKQNRRARQAIELAKENAVPLLNTGFDTAVSEINRSSGESIGALQDAFNTSDNLIAAGGAQAISRFAPFFAEGQRSLGQQSALLGLRGQEAADAAFKQFQESPGQQFLREEGERAIRRNAAATGQLQGGAVLRELTRFGTGLAQQDFGNYFNRLSGLTGLGFDAAGNIAGIDQNTAGNRANLSSELGANIANILGGQGQTLANLATQRGTSLANLELGEASAIAPILQNIGQAKSAGILGQARGFASGFRELNSLAGGSGGFGVPSAPEAANNLQAIGSIVSMFAGGGFGGGAGGAGGLSSFAGALGGGG